MARTLRQKAARKRKEAELMQLEEKAAKLRDASRTAKTKKSQLEREAAALEVEADIRKLKRSMRSRRRTRKWWEI